MLVADRLTASCSVRLSPEGQQYPGVPCEECVQEVEGGDPPAVLNRGEATAGELCRVLAS